MKFAAFHEGRLLPKWTIPQSIGARIHKALEHYLRTEMPGANDEIDQCFLKGMREGDSPIRKLPQKSIDYAKRAFKKLTRYISETTNKVLAIEQRYRYLHKDDGQVEGVVDAVVERKDGAIVLKEWKTASKIESTMRRQYELQARAGALGIAAQKSYSLQAVEIVPILSPDKAISFSVDANFIDDSKKMLGQVFKDLYDRNYEPYRGNHCRACQLKPQCPAWRRR